MAASPFCSAAPFVPRPLSFFLCLSLPLPLSVSSVVCVCCVSIFVFSCFVFLFFWLSDRQCSLNLMSALAWPALAQGKLLASAERAAQRSRIRRVVAPHNVQSWCRFLAAVTSREYWVVYAALSALINEIRERNIIWWIYCYDYPATPPPCPKGLQLEQHSELFLSISTMLSTMFFLPSALNSLCCLSSVAFPFCRVIFRMLLFNSEEKKQQK